MRALEKRILRFAIGGALAVAAVWGVEVADPYWAYGTKSSAPAPKSENAHDTSLKHLPGSSLSFTLAQIQNNFGPADWFPNDHPKMPAIVAEGRKPQVWACALCHFPNGKGKPENASVVGYPVSYFIQQMHEFRDGQRRSADPGKKNTALMASFAKNMTDEEIKQAAEYYCSMKWTPWITVIESVSVPRTYTSVGMYMPLPDGSKEPLGERIIEVPKNPEETEALRNPHSGFLAYVPVGSVGKGKVLAEQQCTVCHGPELKGMGPVPGLAGRSPSYLVRQLYDMHEGTRSGEWTQLMKPTVSRLTQEDMLNVAAYAASLQP